jgi:hypothetical protein
MYMGNEQAEKGQHAGQSLTQNLPTAAENDEISA